MVSRSSGLHTTMISEKEPRRFKGLQAAHHGALLVKLDENLIGIHLHAAAAAGRKG